MSTLPLVVRMLGLPHQGVNVGAIQTGREGDARVTLVPFTNRLSAYENQEVRYDIGRDIVSDRLQKQLRMIITETDTGKSFSKTVTVETNAEKTIDEQKQDFSDEMQKQLKLGSKNYEVKFKELKQEKLRKVQIDRSISNLNDLRLYGYFVAGKG